MKELIKNSINSIKYTVMVDGVETAATNMKLTVYKAGVQVVAPTDVNADSTGVYKFILPTTLTSAEGVLDVTWSFQIGLSALSVDEQYVIVTPYCGWDYFKPIAPATNPTYADFVESERVARFLINSYCLQSFGYEQATLAVEGNGDDSLPLNRHLVSLDGVDWFNNNSIRPGNVIGLTEDKYMEIAADGWVLRYQPNRVNIDPVWNPKPKFRRNITYMVSGYWGYKSVPTEVVEASKILTADLLCKDHKYRDRYIKSLSTGGTRIGFSDEVWQGTGNALVDDMLREYRIYPSIGMI